MRQSERVKLNFGPYRTPRYRLGQKVVCEAPGELTIVGTTDGKIPWPIGKRGRAKSLVLYGDLAKAVKKESVLAIRHWWGIGYSTINNWRKIYGVPPSNPGTAILKREYTKLLFFRAALRKAWAKARDPFRCEKIAASKRGKKRPPHVIARMMAAKLGKPLKARRAAVR